MAGGRPKIIPDIKEVEALAARGLTEEQIAHNLGISYDTLNERKKEFTQYSEAIKRGRASGIAAMANVIFEKAFKDNDSSCAMFYLKCRADWKEKQVNEHTGGEKPIEVKVETPDLDAALTKVIDSVVRG